MKTIKIMSFILFTLLSCFSGLTGQQPGEISYADNMQMPTGKKGELINQTIAAINSQNPEAIEIFIKESCTERFAKMVPMQEHIQVFQSEYQSSGGIDFYSIRTYDPPRENETVVILKDRLIGSWRAYVLYWDTAGDRIAGIRFSPARAPSGIKEPPLNDQALIKEMEKLMSKLKEADAFSGTVLIAKNDDIIYEFACGMASKRFMVKNNIDTKFNLGSMNKMFTSIAINQLVETGKLRLADPISSYLDTTWLAEEVARKITIHHLLSHTSGLGSYFNDKYWNTSRLKFKALNDYKPLIKDETLAFEPGTRFRYSNTGMFLLGVIIEKVTGTSYFDYVRQHISEPAGMQDTDCYEMDSPVPNLAIGYIPDPNPTGWRNNIYDHVLKGGPAGGGFSTVRDLHRFAQALKKGELVSPGTLEIIWKDHAGENYGYGFGVEQHDFGKVVGHGGGFPGLNANLDIFLDTGYVVAVMSNYDRKASPVARRIMELISRI